MGEENSVLFSISIDPEEDKDSGRILYHKEFSIFPDEDAPPSSRSKFRCFNCGSDSHNASECSKKFDRLAFTRNRANFLQQKQQKGEFKRYHIEVDSITKTEATPGIISDKLREALGISSNQLPPYIYRMRSLGYPPGWLEEANISHSGINMIDSNGERVPDPEEEEGEIFVYKTKYDFSKIIEYPGYNVWPAADTINETDKYNAPSMQFMHSKKAFIDFLKQRMDVGKEFVAPKVDMSVDMEAEDVEAGEVIEEKGEFLPPLPSEKSPTPPPPPPDDIPPLPSESKNQSLEEEVEEGEIVLESKTPKSVKRKLDEEHPTVVKSPRTSTHQVSVHDQSADVSSDCANEDYSTPNNTLDSSFGRIISVELGTPALKLHSPFTNLPSSDAFRKDISDVINFENLPNSTGKYEKLKVILKNVRCKMNFFRTNESS